MAFRFTKVDIVLACMVLFWGANITVIKMALADFHPLVFNCFRFLAATIAMMILYRDVFRERPTRKELLSLMVLGFLGNTVYQFFFIYGVKNTYVTHASLMLGVTPIFTAGLSKWLGIEEVRGRLWVGVMLSFTGIMLIVFGTKDFDWRLRGTWGDLLVLGASFVWSIYTAFSKRLVSTYSSRHYVMYTVLFGTAFLIPLSIPSVLNQDWSRIGIFHWVALLYSAFLALVYGYSAWYYGVQKMGSTRTSVYANLTPVAGLLIGMIFLGERLSPFQWLGAGIIFTGLMLNRFAKGSVLEPELNPGLISTK